MPPEQKGRGGEERGGSPRASGGLPPPPRPEAPRPSRASARNRDPRPGETSGTRAGSLRPRSGAPSDRARCIPPGALPASSGARTRLDGEEAARRAERAASPGRDARAGGGLRYCRRRRLRLRAGPLPGSQAPPPAVRAELGGRAVTGGAERSRGGGGGGWKGPSRSRRWVQGMAAGGGAGAAGASAGWFARSLPGRAL